VSEAPRAAIQELYDAYVEALDEGRLEDWPELFTERCLYQVIPRENFERGLPLAAALCESRAGLRDRVTALRRTSMYAPRWVRHLVGGLRVQPGAEGWQVRANYAVFETRVDEPTEILSVGRYQDVVVRDGERLRFREKRCVYDSILVPNSLVYPI
jgi:3-phenylpropionate/cinnamic acid dioxygenase small subunit